MAIHKLSARQVATAGPGKYEDGGGLRLVVSKALSKKWVLRFSVNGRRREMGLGLSGHIPYWQLENSPPVWLMQAWTS